MTIKQPRFDQRFDQQHLVHLDRQQNFASSLPGSKLLDALRRYGCHGGPYRAAIAGVETPFQGRGLVLHAITRDANGFHFMKAAAEIEIDANAPPASFACKPSTMPPSSSEESYRESKSSGGTGPF
jgi:hypothetical protein